MLRKYFSEDRVGVPRVDEATRWEKGGSCSKCRLDTRDTPKHGRGTAHDLPTTSDQTKSPLPRWALKAPTYSLEEGNKARCLREKQELELPRGKNRRRN